MHNELLVATRQRTRHSFGVAPARHSSGVRWRGLRLEELRLIGLDPL